MDFLCFTFTFSAFRITYFMILLSNIHLEIQRGELDAHEAHDYEAMATSNIEVGWYRE